jgi:hypothetical protein
MHNLREDLFEVLLTRENMHAMVTYPQEVKTFMMQKMVKFNGPTIHLSILFLHQYISSKLTIVKCYMDTGFLLDRTVRIHVGFPVSD